MRVHVIHAHPVDTSFSRALCDVVTRTLAAKGHEVDALDLYAEGFEAVLSRAERLNYHAVPANLAPVRPYVDRLRAAEGLVFVHPVWNLGYPAILKGYFDRVFLPGVSFSLSDGDGGELGPCLTNLRRVAYVTSYGGKRARAWLMGDPPRRIARRWGWATFRTRWPPDYLALYDMNNQSDAGRRAFLARVERTIARF